MVTGLEPLIAKAATSSAQRAAGWAAHEGMFRLRRRKVRRLVGEPEQRRLDNAVELVSPDQLTYLREFLNSPEFEHSATQLSRAYLVERCGKKSIELMTLARTELIGALHLQVPSPIPKALEDSIYDSLVDAIRKEIAVIADVSGLSTELQSSLVKSVGSLIAASARNAQLQSGLQQLGAYRDFEADLRQQIASVHATMKLPHAGTTRQVPYAQLFVDPYVLPTSAASPSEGATNEIFTEHPRALSVIDMLSCTTRAVLLGDPGGGKSTLSLKLVYDVASGAQDKLSARIPFLVTLRDYANFTRGDQRKTLAEYLEGLCRSPYNLEPPAGAIDYLLLNDRALVLFDGLDELLDTSLRRTVVEAVEGFAHRYPTTTILVTTRRIGYSEAPLDSDLFPSIQLQPFDNEQVSKYAANWFRLDESLSDSQRDTLESAFIQDSQLVSDLRVNPLMLSLMCGIYATERYIPRNRPEVYEKCALLLFEKWDKQRGIVSPLPFDALVQAAMRALALFMYGRPDREGIPKPVLLGFMTDYLLEKRFEDRESAEDAALQFIDFCKGRAWVLTEVGADTFGFTHRTFLEYFAASQLVRTNPGPKPLFDRLRSSIESATAEVVPQLALQILGRQVEDGADNFLEICVNAANADERNARQLTSFAARALEFVVPRPAIVRAIVSCVVDQALSANEKESRFSTPWFELMACSSENIPGVQRALRDEVSRRLGDAKIEQRLLYLVLVAPDRAVTRLLDRSSLPQRWSAWAVENVEAFKDALLRGRDTSYWESLILAQFGYMSMSDLLQLHTPRSLYEWNVCGDRSIPPFAYRFLMGDRERGAGYGVGLGLQEGSLSTMQIADLTAALVASGRPWFNGGAWMGVLCDAPLGAHPGEVLSALDLLLMLPLVEWELRRPAHDDSRPNSGRRALRMDESAAERYPLYSLARWRANEGRGSDYPTDLDAAIDKSGLRELLMQWSEGRFDTLRLRRPRTRDNGDTTAIEGGRRSTGGSRSQSPRTG